MVLHIVIVIPQYCVQNSCHTSLYMDIQLIPIDQQLYNVSDRVGCELGALAVKVHEVAHICKEVELNLV